MNEDKNGPEDIPVSTGAYWDNRYIHHEDFWDMGQVSPPLKGYIDTLQNKELEILIPGCGNAYEASYLMESGFKNITLVDLSTVVTARLQEKYRNQPVRVVNENFFDHAGSYDLILEQTFFCALDPSLREKYVEKCRQLLKPGGKMAGVLFNKPFTPDQPPFVATDDEYRQYFQPGFTFLQFENCLNSITRRMGTELFFEFEKKP